MEVKVFEIFSSVEGEGLRTGLPSTFVRLYGCNLSCSYCDTQYACTGGGFVSMEIDTVVEAVEELRIPNVTLTGGEPLMHPESYELVKALSDAGFNVNIETNGSILIHAFLDIPNVMLTMDYKSHSSGMTDMMMAFNLTALRECDVIKFVVSDKEDLRQMVAVLKENNVKAQAFVSPVYGKIEPKEIVKFVLNAGLHDVRVQVQLHKIIWDPQERGV